MLTFHWQTVVNTLWWVLSNISQFLYRLVLSIVYVFSGHLNLKKPALQTARCPLAPTAHDVPTTAAAVAAAAASR